MLQFAYPRKEEVLQLFAKLDYRQPRYRFLQNTILDFSLIEIKSTTWEVIQMVSVDSDNRILGFISGNVDQIAHCISNVFTINFSKPRVTWARDIERFIETLRTSPGIRKVKWNVVVGNSSEKLHRAYVIRVLGREVGTFKEDVQLFDGTVCDIRWFEVYNPNYQPGGIINYRGFFKDAICLP